MFGLELLNCTIPVCCGLYGDVDVVEISELLTGVDPDAVSELLAGVDADAVSELLAGLEFSYPGLSSPPAKAS